MSFKIHILFLLFMPYFIGCGNEANSSKISTCRALADDRNITFLKTTLSPIERGKSYIVVKESAYIEPIVSGAEIRLEIITIDLNLDGASDCFKITQDVNDINFARIVIK